jgi:hypothetical protein
MAGPGRGADGSDGAVSSVSERSLFAASVPVMPAPDSLPRLDVRPLPPEGPATVPSPKIGPAVRLRGHLRHLSPSDIRNNVASAAGMEIDRGVAFLLVPVFLACGVIFYYSLAREPDFSQPIAVVVLRHCVRPARAHGAKRICVPGCAAVRARRARRQGRDWRAGTQMVGAEIPTRLTGRIVSLDRMANGRIRLTIDAISTARPALRYMPKRIRASAMKIPPGAAAGSKVTGYVRLLPPTGPVQPDGYDYSFDSYFAGIGASGFFLGTPKTVPPDGASPDGAPLAARLSSAVENRGRASPTIFAAASAAPRARLPPRWSSACAPASPKRSTRRCGAPASITSSPSPACTWRWLPARSWGCCAAPSRCFPISPRDGRSKNTRPRPHSFRSRPI